MIASHVYPKIPLDHKVVLSPVYCAYDLISIADEAEQSITAGFVNLTGSRHYGNSSSCISVLGLRREWTDSHFFLPPFFTANQDFINRTPKHFRELVQDLDVHAGKCFVPELGGRLNVTAELQLKLVSVLNANSLTVPLNRQLNHGRLLCTDIRIRQRVNFISGLSLLFP